MPRKVALPPGPPKWSEALGIPGLQIVVNRMRLNDETRLRRLQQRLEAIEAKERERRR